MVLEVSKVSSRVWKSAISDSFSNASEVEEAKGTRIRSPLNSRQRQLAYAVLFFGQNRHVGITPWLSRSIALSILNAEQSAYPLEPWNFVSKRLLQQIDCLEKGKIEIEDRVTLGRRQVGILRSAPVYFLLRIVLPIVEVATRSLGRSMLFTESDDPESSSLSEYKEYDKALSNLIGDISQNTDRPMYLFWSERAAILSGYLRFRRSKKNDGGRLPEMDAPALAYLLRLNPQVKSMAVNDKQIQVPQNEQQIQQIPKQQAAGVNGIRITRSLDDINAILHSELALPPELLVDKLANEGYLIYERNPKKQENRDVLVVGLTSPDICSENTLGWLKACWFEAMARLSLILLKAKLTKSDLDWVQADRSGNWRSFHHPIHKLTDSGNLTKNYSEWYRGHFLTTQNWLPEFLSVGASIIIPRERKQASGDDVGIAETSAVELDQDSWVEDAWQSYVEDRVRTESSSNAADGWASQYRYIHVMIFLPISCKTNEAESSEILNRYLRQLHLSAQFKRYISIVWVPEAFQSIEELSCWFSEGNKLHLETRMKHTDHDEGMITSWLVSRWIRNLIKEIWNG